MTRDQAIGAYRRVKAWEREHYASLLKELGRKSGIEGLTPHLLHNWHDLPEYPQLRQVYRWWNYVERKHRDTSTRLEDHFAAQF